MNGFEQFGDESKWKDPLFPDEDDGQIVAEPGIRSLNEPPPWHGLGAESKWKDPLFVALWTAEQKAKRKKGCSTGKGSEESSLLDFPLLSGIPRSANASENAELAQAHAQQWAAVHTGHTLTQRARLLDGASYLLPNKKRDARTANRPPELLWRDADGDWHLPEWIVPQGAIRPEKLAKAQSLYRLGLKKKAQRELACGLLGGPVVCRSGHQFRVGYRCNDRFCIDCAESYSRKLFATAWKRMEPVANVLCPCWPPHSSGQERRAVVKEINSTLEKIRRTKHQRAELRQQAANLCRSIPVIAKIDFTMRSDGTLSTSQRQRALGQAVKEFFRACERQFGFSREQYGVAVHMETSKANMSHAHGCYVGPWLPNKQKQLSRIWAKVSPDRSFIISVKYARNLAQALAHATKYPRKLVFDSTPERLAELELTYSRVRMFRLLGAFDKRVATKLLLSAGLTLPEPESTGRKCPLCGKAIAAPEGWRLLSDLKHLPDLNETQLRLNRDRIFSGPHGPP